MDTHGVPDLFGMLEPKKERTQQCVLPCGASDLLHAHHRRPEGTSERGVRKRTTTPETRGPLCPESIGAITAGALGTFFNGVIRILAAGSFFPKNSPRPSRRLPGSNRPPAARGFGGEGEGPVPPSFRPGRIRKVMETVFQLRDVGGAGQSSPDHAVCRDRGP
jgi:hypothetical protein